MECCGLKPFGLFGDGLDDDEDEAADDDADEDADDDVADDEVLLLCDGGLDGAGGFVGLDGVEPFFLCLDR